MQRGQLCKVDSNISRLRNRRYLGQNKMAWLSIRKLSVSDVVTEEESVESEHQL